MVHTNINIPYGEDGQRKKTAQAFGQGLTTVDRSKVSKNFLNSIILLSVTLSGRGIKVYPVSHSQVGTKENENVTHTVIHVCTGKERNKH